MRSVDAWFDPIYKGSYKKVFHTAYYLSEDERLAEEVVQDAFVCLLMKSGELRDHPNIQGWLVTTVRNLMMNELRRAYRSQEIPIPADREIPAGGEAASLLELLPQELSEAERQLLYLHMEAGYSHNEIAAHLGCSPEACRMRLSRAKKRCKELLLEAEDRKPSKKVR